VLLERETWSRRKRYRRRPTSIQARCDGATKSDMAVGISSPSASCSEPESIQYTYISLGGVDMSDDQATSLWFHSSIRRPDRSIWPSQMPCRPALRAGRLRRHGRHAHAAAASIGRGAGSLDDGYLIGQIAAHTYICRNNIHTIIDNVCISDHMSSNGTVGCVMAADRSSGVEATCMGASPARL
jgi:hypothetical protein